MKTAEEILQEKGALYLDDDSDQAFYLESNALSAMETYANQQLSKERRDKEQYARVQSIEFLGWATRSENTKHAVDNKLHCFGSRSAHAKVNEADVVSIINNVENRSIKELAIHYLVDTSTIRSIIKRKTWKHVTLT